MLIDEYQREYHFNELHRTQISAPPECIYPIIKSIDFFKSRTIGFLFTVRGLPRGMCSLESFIESGFILLGERVGEEILIGLLFHPLRFRPICVSPDEFRRFHEGNHVKAVMNFHLSKIDENTSLLTTESRVFCTSGKARLMFTPYWLLISRFSGLIRIIMLRLIRQEAEKERGPSSCRRW